MKIVVNDIAASKGGAITILKGFYNYIKNNGKEHEWVFLLGDNLIDETENIKVITFPEIKESWIKRLVFDLDSGKKHINAFKPDAVLSLQNTIVFGLHIPQAVYVHQSIPFQQYKRFSFFKSNERILAVYQYIIGTMIRKSVKHADLVFVQTKWMRRAVSKFTGVSEHKIVAALPDIDNLSEYRDENVFESNCFFYPTDNYIYKNNECINIACSSLLKQGISEFNVKLTLSIKSEIKNIINIGRITPQQVIAEYNKSTLIFPSYIETVGLPMAEARQMGTIILASDCEFSHEVLDGYENVYYFNPFVPEELAELMKKVIFGEIIRHKVKEKEINFIKNGYACILDTLYSIR